jgi:isoleucyl-tRNA synthetase
VDEWLRVRGVIYQQAIEPARQTKTIAKSLEATVVLNAPEKERAALEAVRAELEEFFIVSELTLEDGSELKARVVKSPEAQCPRCWRYLRLTARGLCERCSEAVPA